MSVNKRNERQREIEGGKDDIMLSHELPCKTVASIQSTKWEWALLDKCTAVCGCACGGCAWKGEQGNAKKKKKK